MCGIVGIVGRAATEPTIKAMLQTQRHRGPDHTGWMIPKQGVALGHNRLSIIDLSSEANQPMEDLHKRYVIVFNGEIYNYRELRERLAHHYPFRTSSDTEVLLAAYSVWGEQMLERLNGMFAFVIYDRKSGTLFGARDRFGVKPLYYVHNVEGFYFASEIKAFEAAELRLHPDESVWASYLAYGTYGQPHESFWEGVRQLEAGCCFHYDDNAGLKIRRWYDFVARVSDRDPMSLDELEAHYESLMEESVAFRFRADVKVGFNLSGGLDSSTLLAMVHKTDPSHGNITAYTFYTGDERYDELKWVEMMLEHTGNPLQKVRLDVSDVPRLAQELYEVQYEPYGGIPTIAYYNLFRQARQDGTPVLLDGQGMDEQWAGYDYYTSKQKSVVQGVKTAATRIEALNKDFVQYARKNDFPTPFAEQVQNLQYRDLFYTKIPRALRFNDRVSMASSVELREPFLDYRLVEMAFAQPLSYKIHNGQKKWMLRRIARKYLGDQIALAPKRPLQTPQREWLGSELSGFVEMQLERIAQSPVRQWFDMDALYAEWQDYKHGNQDNAFYVWQWVSVGMMIKARCMGNIYFL